MQMANVNVQFEQVRVGSNEIQPGSPLQAVVKGFQTIERHVDERLDNETEETLNAKIKADIVVMCQERGQSPFFPSCNPL